jgi:hypothetical protein
VRHSTGTATVTLELGVTERVRRIHSTGEDTKLENLKLLKNVAGGPCRWHQVMYLEYENKVKLKNQKWKRKRKTGYLEKLVLPRSA